MLSIYIRCSEGRSVCTNGSDAGLSFIDSGAHSPLCVFVHVLSARTYVSFLALWPSSLFLSPSPALHRPPQCLLSGGRIPGDVCEYAGNDNDDDECDDWDDWDDEDDGDDEWRFTTCVHACTCVCVSVCVYVCV